MRLLIVTYSYYPALTPRAFRWTAIAEHLAARGIAVDVVCSADRHSPANELRGGVNIHRAGGNAREGLKRWLGRESPAGGAATDADGAPSSVVRGRIGSLLKKIYTNTLQKIMWPDFSGFWYFPALAAANSAIRERQHDAVITVSVPFTGHLVGRALKRRYAAMRWVVDIGDPFSFMTETPVNNHKLFGRLNHRTELSVLQGADYVSVTTEETKAEYLKCFPNIEGDKISVIPPLFTVPQGMDEVTSFFAGPPKIRLVFAGTLYSKIRNPAAVLKLFRSLLTTPMGEQLELHFFGAVNDCDSYFESVQDLIGREVFLHGLVPRLSALRAMKESTVLVNLGNATAYQLPSKVVEYLLLGKPVLNITRSIVDSSGHFFSGLEGVCSVTEGGLSEDPAEFGRVYDFIANPPPIAQTEMDRLARAHGLDAIGDEYLKLLLDKIPAHRTAI